MWQCLHSTHSLQIPPAQGGARMTPKTPPQQGQPPTQGGVHQNRGGNFTPGERPSWEMAKLSAVFPFLSQIGEEILHWRKCYTNRGGNFTLEEFYTNKGGNFTLAEILHWFYMPECPPNAPLDSHFWRPPKMFLGFGDYDFTHF